MKLIDLGRGEYIAPHSFWRWDLYLPPGMTHFEVNLHALGLVDVQVVLPAEEHAALRGGVGRHTLFRRHVAGQIAAVVAPPDQGPWTLLVLNRSVDPVWVFGGVNARHLQPESQVAGEVAFGGVRRR